MEIIKPIVELWDNSDGPATAARAARICKASEKGSDEKLLEICRRDGHLSVFRHWSHYYVVSAHSNAGLNLIYYCKLNKIFGSTPYITIIVGTKNRTIYMSTNHQYLLEHPEFAEMFNKYEVDLETFVNCLEAVSAVRYTFCITTSIKVSRELNRTSPNNICEQSTRYVNFYSKTGDVQICESLTDGLETTQSVAIYDSLERSCKEYLNLIACGVTSEQARRVLPLDTATKVVYTYTLNEWKHILDLRYFEKTGKAAPDAKLVAGEIYKILKTINYGTLDS